MIFNVIKTIGCIEAPRNVLGELQPSLVIDFVHTTFTMNPIVRPLLHHSNMVDITTILAGLLPHMAKSKD